MLYVHIIHSRHHELRQQQHDNKASITETAESSAHMDGIALGEVQTFNVRLSVESIVEDEHISCLLRLQT